MPLVFRNKKKLEHMKTVSENCDKEVSLLYTEQPDWSQLNYNWLCLHYLLQPFTTLQIAREL